MSKRSRRGSEAADQRRDERSRPSSLPPPGPRYRWSSSSSAQARSWHLLICQSPATCSRSALSPSAASYSVEVLETMHERQSSFEPSTDTYWPPNEAR